jgi:AcrR family transcriptional regulator
MNRGRAWRPIFEGSPALQQSEMADPSEQRPPRERILDTAYELFSRHGIGAVGVDRIVAESSVAKMTLYRHFPSKTELALAFLELRDQRWTRDWLQSEVHRMALTPRDRLLAIFDAFDEWFHRPDYEGCSFVNTLLEMPESDPLHEAAAHHLDVIRSFIEDLARQAGMEHPKDVAFQLQLVMIGAIVAAGRGDLDAARRARDTAELILGNDAA